MKYIKIKSLEFQRATDPGSPDPNLTKLGWENGYTTFDGQQVYVIHNTPTKQKPNQRVLAQLLWGNHPIVMVNGIVRNYDTQDRLIITAETVSLIWDQHPGAHIDVPDEVIFKAGELVVADKMETAPEPWVDECITPMEEYGLLGTR